MAESAPDPSVLNKNESSDVTVFVVAVPGLRGGAEEEEDARDRRSVAAETAAPSGEVEVEVDVAIVASSKSIGCCCGGGGRWGGSRRARK